MASKPLSKMPDWWAWAGFGVKIALTVGAKVGAKTACNFCAPGSGAAVDLCLAGKCLYDGDIVGAAFSFFDAATCGSSGAIQEAMKGSAKSAATETVKETAKSARKEATKKVGREFSKKLAKGVIEGGKDAAVDVVKMAAKSASKEATKKVGQQFGKEIAQGMITLTVEDVYRQGIQMPFLEALRQTTSLADVSGEDVLTACAEGAKMFWYEMTKEPAQKFTFTELTKQAAIKGAEEEFKNLKQTAWAAVLDWRVHNAIMDNMIVLIVTRVSL